MASIPNPHAHGDDEKVSMLSRTNRSTRLLYRYNKHTHWVMSHIPQQGYNSFSLADVEEVAENFLDDSQQPLHYINRDDFVWLNCRRPLYHLESVFGLEEESEIPPSQRMVSIVTYSLSPMDSSADCHPFTTDIAPLVHRRMTLPQASTSMNKEVSSTGIPIVIEWVDGRALKTDFVLTSNADCAYFLRSLLDARHDASPWVIPAKSSGTDHEDDKDMVVLVVDRQSTPEKLINFRVSDACPSWFLHAVGHIKNVNAVAMPWLSTNVEQAEDSGNANEAAMLIYRRLSPRIGLSNLHPQSQQPVHLRGCLWEQSLKVKEEGTPPEIRYQIVGPPILDPREEYPNLLESLLEPNTIDVLRGEAIQIAHWTAWPEQQHYKATSETGEAPWNVFPLCHTFPADDLTKRQWVPTTCAVVPQTVAHLKSKLGDTLRTALFSRLDPESVLEAHTGWEDLANHVLRVHIPLVLPPGDLCGVWVDGCVQLHREGEALCFDDSKTHRAFNYSSEARIVLILDLVRPATLPRGSATGGHSDELDEFIGRMGVAR